MIRLTYREDKATQAVARLLLLSGNSMDILKLVKLIYLADRRAILAWGRPITFDSYVSMPHGPVPSFTLDRINFAEPKSYWRRYIAERNRNIIALQKATAPHNRLSPAEVELLDGLWKEFGKMTGLQLRDYSHKLPEWRDPKGSSLPISIEDILATEGFSVEDIRDVVEALRAEEFAVTLDG